LAGDTVLALAQATITHFAAQLAAVDKAVAQTIDHDPAHYEGQRYFVSMLGDGSEWVQNVRTSSREAFVKRGRSSLVILTEIPPEARAPIF